MSDPLMAGGGAEPDAVGEVSGAPGVETGTDAGGEGDVVLVTISKKADGGYVVHAGDEPEGGAPDAGGLADPAAMGGEAIEAASIGEALKAAMDILNQDAGGGEEGAEDEFQAGFKSDASAPMPAV